MLDALLVFIIAGLIIERYFYTKEVNERTEEYMRAIMSRTLNEYVSTAPKKEKTNLRTESDEVDLDQASEKEFLEHIKS